MRKVIIAVLILIGLVVPLYSKRPQVETAPPYFPDELDIWLMKLASHEGCKPEGTMDRGSLSYGLFCYKEGTFKMFVKKYDLLPNAEEDEIMNLIGDAQFQWKLTRMVFEDSCQNWRNWYTSTVKKIGLPPNCLK